MSRANTQTRAYANRHKKHNHVCSGLNHIKISMSKRCGESFAAFRIPEYTYRQHDVYVEISKAVAWSHVLVDLSSVLMRIVAEEGTLTMPTQASGSNVFTYYIGRADPGRTNLTPNKTTTAARWDLTKMDPRVRQTVVYWAGYTDNKGGITKGTTQRT